MLVRGIKQVASASSRMQMRSFAKITGTVKWYKSFQKFKIFSIFRRFRKFCIRFQNFIFFISFVFLFIFQNSKFKTKSGSTPIRVSDSSSEMTTRSISPTTVASRRTDSVPSRTARSLSSTPCRTPIVMENSAPRTLPALVAPP